MFNFDETQIDKLNAYRENGIEPYPHNLEINMDDFYKQILYAQEASIMELPDIKVQIAGRLRFKNEMGNAGFARIYIGDIKVQIFISKKEIGAEAFSNIWRKLDLGDTILVDGSFMRTRMGELSLRASSIKLISKCINTMPDKFSGVSDPETLQRQRYLDLMVNTESMERFRFRSIIISQIRNHMISRGFLEVETPILQNIPGGASAKPFTTHHNALDLELYMRIAPELFLKRLVVGGMNQVFEIGKNFRNEGISTKHNPEFTMMEFYAAYKNYEWLMNFVQNLIQELVVTKKNNYMRDDLTLAFKNHIIDFNVWERKTFIECIKNAGVQDPWSITSLQDFIRNSLKVEPPSDITKLWDMVFSECVEPNLINPTFITHYPVEISPLARRCDDEPRLTERFELFIAGYEISNGFNELNDPIDQAERFKQQVNRKSNGDDEAMFFDSDYINALCYGMAPTAGCGIGIDRMVMLLTNSASIRDIILFPTRK